MKPIHKFNNGNGATLCHKCSVIISVGLTDDLYCEECKKKQDMKQTTIEFLQEALSIHLTFDQQMRFEGLFQQAKEMEKQQIVDAYDAGLFDGSMDDVNDRIYKQYYNETFNK